tara:strand:+ start:44919 stop:47069 length:2151 start_codon:yes stop_codon:yes gene_type:complete
VTNLRKQAFSFLFFILSGSAYGQISDYIYPNTYASYSNYGTLGLIQLPNARLFDEGTLSFSWSHNDPYLRGSLIAYPFEWMEASFQYTDINNALYSSVESFSGTQSLKDKGFDIKLRLLKETKFLPQVALGIRDIGGTSLFASEFLVASKSIKNIDFTLGMGWGILSDDTFSNPLGNINERFYKRQNRDLESTAGGGALNANTFFTGKYGIFGGVELFLPKSNGTRLKIEFDTTDYENEGRQPVQQESKINFGIVKPLSKNFFVKLAYVKGNTLNFGFSYKIHAGKQENATKKIDDLYVPVENSKIVRRVTSKSDLLLYRAALKNLNDRDFVMKLANIDEGELHVAYQQNKFSNYSLAAVRVLRTLDEISPEQIERFRITNLNGELGLNSISVSRENFKNSLQRNTPELLLKDTLIEGYTLNKKQFKYQPVAQYPAFHYSVEPDLQSQIGGPDGFWFAALRLALDSELMINKDLSLTGRFSYGVIGDFDEIKLASDSIIPHVRTDIVDYLQEGDNFSIDRLQLNSFSNPYKNIYTKFTAGIFERMFGGYGAEFLYRPFDKNYGIGLEAFRVRQRDFKQNMDFRDYETSTGHITYYYREPSTGVLLRLKGGKYLAGDSGYTFDISRRFETGMSVGIFFSRTDISKEEFGEGSFDKGFYFMIPIDFFTTSYVKRTFQWGIRPVTRDGAALLTHGLPLWGVTDQANYWPVTHTWKNIYE